VVDSFALDFGDETCARVFVSSYVAAQPEGVTLWRVTLLREASLRRALSFNILDAIKRERTVLSYARL
jgi:hypothetical protein